MDVQESVEWDNMSIVREEMCLWESLSQVTKVLLTKFVVYFLIFETI